MTRGGRSDGAPWSDVPEWSKRIARVTACSWTAPTVVLGTQPSCCLTFQSNMKLSVSVCGTIAATASIQPMNEPRASGAIGAAGPARSSSPARTRTYSCRTYELDGLHPCGCADPSRQLACLGRWRRSIALAYIDCVIDSASTPAAAQNVPTSLAPRRKLAGAGRGLVPPLARRAARRATRRDRTPAKTLRAGHALDRRASFARALQLARCAAAARAMTQRRGGTESRTATSSGPTAARKARAGRRRGDLEPPLVVYSCAAREVALPGNNLLGPSAGEGGHGFTGRAVCWSSRTCRARAPRPTRPSLIRPSAFCHASHSACRLCMLYSPLSRS